MLCWTRFIATTRQITTMSALNTKLLGLALALAFAAQSANAWGSHTVGHGTCIYYTKFLPRNKEYREHWEAEAGPSGSDPKWPCFTMWYSTLDWVIATTPSAKDDPDKDIFLMKDGYKQGELPHQCSMMLTRIRV